MGPCLLLIVRRVLIARIVVELRRTGSVLRTAIYVSLNVRAESIVKIQKGPMALTIVRNVI